MRLSKGVSPKLDRSPCLLFPTLRIHVQVHMLLNVPNPAKMSILPYQNYSSSLLEDAKLATSHIISFSFPLLHTRQTVCRLVY